jgi:hypothetical protein
VRVWLAVGHTDMRRYAEQGYAESVAAAVVKARYFHRLLHFDRAECSA